MKMHSLVLVLLILLNVNANAYGHHATASYNPASEPIHFEHARVRRGRMDNVASFT